MRWLKRMFIVLIVLGVAVGGGYVYWHAQLTAPIALKQDTFYEVERGDSVHHVLDELASRNVIDHVWPYQLLGILEPEHLSKLRAGEFKLTPDMNAYQLLAKLSSNDVVTYQLTIPEGRTFAEMRHLIDEAPKLKHETAGLSDEALMTRLGHGDEAPEGRFFPSTYRYHKGTSDLVLYRQAYQHMHDALAKTWEKRQEGLPLDNAYQALILASLIEKETGAPEERREIAGVFVRRLERGMRLQTDPTVIYGLGNAYDGSLTRADLTKATAYNTYVIDGLPPTPIALPGLAALEAAVDPKQGDSLYFVSKGDGHHHFSSTLAEHNAAVRRYILNR
ncbi:endolytic transglycosylase MltG [Phytohalomonas tamaricis]|uniref:endolytic transglycosylase MltG n=1 Tax=Phytohalomonas tamaricis TaxID=2081032 RepID=UPI000D0AD571|nr:endolytic transglycosylase MltG [Phytohalomonas tamaricis]